MNTKWILVIFIAFAGLFFTGCESDEDNTIASAQACLDKLRSTSDPSEAQKCKNMVSGMTSQRAYVIKCAADFFLGGVTTAEIVQALIDYNDALAADKEATLLIGLQQTSGALADITYNSCRKTGVPGMIYVASISKMGTILAGANGGGGNPAAQVAYCATTPTPADCDPEDIGKIVVDLAPIYCQGGATESQICKDLESAIAGAPAGDYEAIAEALFNFFAN